MFRDRGQNRPLQANHRADECVDDDEQGELPGVGAETEPDRPGCHAAPGFMPASTGMPANCHSGKPTGRRRARRPAARSCATA